MTVISMAVDGCGERIDGLKIRVVEEVAIHDLFPAIFGGEDYENYLGFA